VKRVRNVVETATRRGLSVTAIGITSILGPHRIRRLRIDELCTAL
jgi:hypothetical protein